MHHPMVDVAEEGAVEEEVVGEDEDEEEVVEVDEVDEVDEDEEDWEMRITVNAEIIRTRCPTGHQIDKEKMQSL